MLYQLLIIGVLLNGKVIENTRTYPSYESCIAAMETFIDSASDKGNFVVTCREIEADD